MEYVKAFSSRRGLILLEDGATRAGVAAECRHAGLELIDGIASGWDKIDLALWLTGPYAHATRHRERGGRVAEIDGRATVQASTLEELMTRVRAQVVALLERAALAGGRLDFAEEVVELGHVRRALDETGGWVWIPVDGARLRLKDRVLALFVADYLNDPVAYATLYVCHRCESVTFDENAKKVGVCRRHRRVSGVRATDEATRDARRGARRASGRV